MRQADLVGVIEAAYAPASTDGAWLTGLLEASAPLLDEGLGLAAWTYDAGESLRLGEIVGSDQYVAAARGAFGTLTPEYIRRIYLSAPINTSSALVAASPRQPALEQVEVHFAQTGYRDVLGIAATNPDGRGVCLSACLKEVTRVEPRRARMWSRLSAHLAAGLRLRDARRSDEALEPEAVLKPDGAPEHLSGAATTPSVQSALRQAAVAADRARGRLRRDDPGEAVESWRALVAGRWSLVDRFDDGGRRYLIARRNEPRTQPRVQLSARERQVASYAARGHANKQIAYTLGISTSSVATHLAAACQKLGVASRVELIDVFGRLPIGGGEP